MLITAWSPMLVQSNSQMSVLLIHVPWPILAPNRRSSQGRNGVPRS